VKFPIPTHKYVVLNYGYVNTWIFFKSGLNWFNFKNLKNWI